MNDKLQMIFDLFSGTLLLDPLAQDALITAILTGHFSELDFSGRMESFRSEEGQKQAGIGIVPILGTLTPESYRWIIRGFSQAMDDQAVKRILLYVDSHGGLVTGLFDTIDEIYNARGQKPIDAYLGETGLSAAYGLASSADKIYLPRTGRAGSIGVYGRHVDFSELEKKLGVKFTPVYQGARKNDFSPHAPLSKEALELAEKEGGAIWTLFINTVSRNRGISPEKIRVMDAGVFTGEDAVKNGLADEVRSWSQMVDSIELSENTGGNMASLKESLENLAAHGAPFVAALAEMGYVPAGKQEEQAAAIEAAKAEGKTTGIEEGKKAGKEAARQEAKALVGLCEVAGMPDLLPELIKNDATMDQAKQKVQERRSGGEQREEIFQTTSPTGTGGKNALLAEVDARVKGDF